MSKPYIQGRKWSVRWYENVRQKDGTIRRVRRSKAIADAHDFKRSEAADLAHEFLERVAPSGRPDAFNVAVTVRDFVNLEFLPYVEATLAASTLMGYSMIWRVYEHYVPEKLRMREARTVDCQKILYDIHARRPELTKLTLRHIKAFFSGVFTHALRLGVIDRGNPWVGTAIPAGRQSEDTVAYTPEEISVMLSLVPEPANSMLLLAACTGLRRGEIAGLQWQDWDKDTCTLNVRRSAFGIKLKGTKSKASKAPVPVVPILAARLEQLRARAEVYYPERLIFAARAGTPKNLNNVANRWIKPTLKGTSVKWAGWHAFRRGLGTWLHSCGVDDKTIQAVLRHQNVAVTQAAYIKTVAKDVRKAMENVTFGQTATEVVQ